MGHRRVQDWGHWSHPRGWGWVTGRWEAQGHGWGVVWLTSGLQRKALRPSTLRQSSKQIFKGWGRKVTALSCLESDSSHTVADTLKQAFLYTLTSCESHSKTVCLLFDKSVLFQIRYLVNSGSNLIIPDAYRKSFLKIRIEPNSVGAFINKTGKAERVSLEDKRLVCLHSQILRLRSVV